MIKSKHFPEVHHVAHGLVLQYLLLRVTLERRRLIMLLIEFKLVPPKNVYKI